MAPMKTAHVSPLTTTEARVVFAGSGTGTDDKGQYRETPVQYAFMRQKSASNGAGPRWTEQR